MSQVSLSRRVGIFREKLCIDKTFKKEYDGISALINIMTTTPKDIRHPFRKGIQRSKKVFRLTITSKTVATLAKEDSLKFTSAKVTDVINLIRRSSPDSEIRRILKNMVRTSKELEKLRHKHDKLQRINHELEVLNLEKKASEEKREILQETCDTWSHRKTVEN